MTTTPAVPTLDEAVAAALELMESPEVGFFIPGDPGENGEEQIQLTRKGCAAAIVLCNSISNIAASVLNDAVVAAEDNGEPPTDPLYVLSALRSHLLFQKASEECQSMFMGARFPGEEQDDEPTVALEA